MSFYTKVYPFVGLLLALLAQDVAAQTNYLKPIPPIAARVAALHKRADLSNLDLQSQDTFLWGGKIMRQGDSCLPY
jgi:hypothetical protein